MGENETKRRPVHVTTVVKGAPEPPHPVLRDGVLQVVEPFSEGATISVGRTMPRQKPGLSRSDYATPDDLIAAVKKKFGVTAFAFDLAADLENAKAPHFYCKEEDALSLDRPWNVIEGDLWLNPPFNDIEPWARRCEVFGRSASLEARLFFLVPASVGSNWWRDYVHDHAAVLFLNGRPSFDGKGPYPKDCALCVYGRAIEPGYFVWRWK